MGLRLLALAFLVGAALAGPLQKENYSKCARQCSNLPNPKFGYEIGKSYTYEWRGENIVSATGKPRQKASVEGVAVITVMDQCEMVLQLKNIRLEQKAQSEEIEQLSDRLQEPLPFAFDDGSVDHVCPSSDEDYQSLNIKKGIISSFVNTMPKLDAPTEVKEFDSLGNCTTKYTVKYSQGLVIQKQKSLKSCTNRHSSVTSLITTPYESEESKMHTIPIFPEETLECTQHVEDKIIKKVQCQEHAKIQPLSQRSSVIQFEGKCELSLLSISRAERIRSSPHNKPETVMFTYEERKDEKSRQREAEQLLREMCSKNIPSMDITVSKDFIQLVTLVKSLPHSSLSKIHSSLKNGPICSSKKVHDLFVDTLPMAGSDAAIKLMVQLLEKEEITGLKAKLWPAALALIPNPSRETVAEIIPLLRMQSSNDKKSSQPSAVVLLGISAMVHRFCSIRDCSRERSVQEITSLLNEHVGQQCSNENENQILAALKAFGNMGHHGNAERHILACAQNKDKSTRLRLAAIDAFRRINKKRPEQILAIYADSQEMPEIRIAAFASCMKQADEQQIRSIKRIAEQENDEQVSGYASSFINNMKKTSSPLKKNVKRLLQQIEINPPTVNFWQNSKNIEISTFSKTFNMGGSVETDIIHSKDSKIPRSVTARFDTDVLNHNMNIFEIGVRAEGLEGIFKNLLGLKNETPQKSLSPWSILTSEGKNGDDEAEASAFIRTMNTEILDISASDLSGVGEMIKIADLMNQLAQGKSSDFSQSFLFLNSKLVIPSVTGRSYSFGVTGSATLGLTASSKLDVMKFPRNTDAKAHFQPSLNVELSTTVGIQSSQHRPDIKLTSRMHLESNMEAQFKIKDGHLAIASVSLPSENVVLARVSSDVVEIDAHHQEKPVFERMQKKVDYCFDKLQKPLGISICGMLEVPKPFVTKTFPFVYGVGSLEFAIKKTDRDLKSFELKLERSRHSQAPVRKFVASFDTPGTRTSRRFAAELEVRQQGRNNQELSLELTSPFKNAGGKGSFTSREDFLQGSLEIHSSSSQLISINASAQISSSHAKKVYKPSLEISLSNNQPLQIGGVVSVTNGRKQVVSVDIQTNKPSRRPISLRGTITKEGTISLSKKDEWKVSSDLSLESMFFDAQCRTMLEKQSKQAQTVSASIETDYKRGSQRHSMKLSGTTQQSSSKVSSNAQFQSTQFPMASWNLKWEMQGKPHQSLKNDLTLKYGRNPESSYISIKQNSNIHPSNGPGQCNVAVKAPQLDIDSELTLTHEVSLSTETNKIQLGADLRYHEDKHIRGLLYLDSPSYLPLKASSKVELEYPGGKLTYSDEVEETSRNRFEGNSRMQWKDNRPVQLKYILKILSDSSKIHHELDASLQLPSRQSPIQSKFSLEVSSESLKVDGSLSSRRSSEYSIQAQINQLGSSSVRLQTPKVDGDLKVQNEEQKKVFDMELRLKGSKPRRVIASTKAQLGQKKSFEVEMSWDADRSPEKKISFTSKGEITSSSLSVSSRLQGSNLIDITLNRSGQKSLFGDCEGNLEVSIKNRQPIRLDYSHKLSSGLCKCQLKYSQNRMEKFEVKLEGKDVKTSNRRDLGMKASLTSLDGSFQSKELELSHSRLQSGTSAERTTSIRVQRSPNKVYKAEVSSESQPNGIQVQAQVNTPHSKYSQQSASMSLQKSDNSILSTVRVELPENRVISVRSEMQKKSGETSATLVIKSPIKSASEIKAYVSIDNQSSQKSMLSYLDVNNARLADLEASTTKSSSEKSLQCQLKISPMPNVKFQGVSMSYKQSKSSVEMSGEVQMQGEKKVSVSSQLSNQRSGVSASLSLNTPFKKLQSVSASFKQSRNSVELSGSTRYMGDKQMSMSSQITKERSKLSATATLSSPYQVKEAKAHFLVESQNSRKSLMAYVDANGERKCDVEMTYSSSPNGIQLQSRMKTARSQEISAHAQLEKSGKSFSFEAKINKGASYLRSSTHKQQPRNLEQSILDLLDLSISRESSTSSDQYRVKLAGPVTPVTLSLSASQSQSREWNIEASACQTSQQSKCYTLKSIRKALSNAEGYRQYQRLSLELEKTIDSRSEQVGSSNIVFTASEHDYSSIVTVVYQGKTLGYEVRAHKREHSDDHCSVDAHIFMNKQVSRVKASLLKKQNRFSLEVEAIPDSSIPQKKFGIEMQKEQKQTNELSGYLKLSHPNMEKPILLTAQIQKQGWIPVQGKCELQYSSSKQSRVESKSLTLEIASQLQQRSSGKKFISYKLNNSDKTLQLSLELKKDNSRQHDSYGYEWSYKKQSRTQKGGVSVRLSQKQNGRPQNIDISYYTPSVALELQGRTSVQSPQDLSISLLSQGQQVKEIKITTSENCLEMQVQRSGPFFKSSLCINKRVGQSVQFVALDAHCQGHKCLDWSVGIDPATPSFILIQMQWNKKDLSRALEEVSGLSELLRDQSLQELERELKEHISHWKNDIVLPACRDLMDKLRRLTQEQVQKLNKMVSQHQQMLRDQTQQFKQLKDSIFDWISAFIPWDYIHNQVLHPLIQSLRCLFDAYFQLALKHIPDLAQIAIEVTKEQITQCLRKFCVEGTFCYDIWRTYERHGMKQAQKLAVRKMQKVKQSVQNQISQLNPLSELSKKIRQAIEFLEHETEELYRKLSQTEVYKKAAEMLKEWKPKLRHQALVLIEKLIEKISQIYSKVERDEDFQTVRSMTQGFENKLKNVWDNRQTYAEKLKSAWDNKVNYAQQLKTTWENREREWEPLKQNLMNKSKELMKGRLEVQRFEPQRGDIKILVRHPLEQRHIQVVQNLLKATKQKLQQSFSA